MGGSRLIRAFLRSCSKKNLPVGDTVYKIKYRRKKNMYRWFRLYFNFLFWFSFISTIGCWCCDQFIAAVKSIYRFLGGNFFHHYFKKSFWFSVWRRGIKTQNEPYLKISISALQLGREGVTPNPWPCVRDPKVGVTLCINVWFWQCL